jgi:uncharacterized protein (TIGR02145 family)
MKKIFVILTLLCFGAIQAQPQKINYQAVAVNASGVTVKNRVISLRLSILDSSSTGSVLYTETHQPTTDGSGQFSVYLGGGTVNLGMFSNIVWGNGKAKFLKVEADVNGGTNYVVVGTSQIVSVPYALSAGSLVEGATITGANGSQYTLTVGANGPVWNLTNLNGNFSCGQPVIYDGELYPTVKIGDQCWFQKNLNVGTIVNIGIANDLTNNGLVEKYCYNDIPANCDTFGGLYQWAEAVQYKNGASNTNYTVPTLSGNIQGICPKGWHIPSDAEFCTVTTFIDPTVNCQVVPAQCQLYFPSGTDIGLKLKDTTTLWNTPGSNTSNFSAIPGGKVYLNYGTTFTYRFGGVYDQSSFWTSTENSNNEGFFRQLNASNLPNLVERNFIQKKSGFSIRCLKD